MVFCQETMHRAFRSILPLRACIQPLRPLRPLQPNLPGCPVVDMYHEGPSPLPVAESQLPSGKDNCPQNNRSCPFNSGQDDEYVPEYQPCRLGNSCPMLIWNGN